jgi:hypothetical protein
MVKPFDLILPHRSRIGAHFSVINKNYVTNVVKSILRLETGYSHPVGNPGKPFVESRVF